MYIIMCLLIETRVIEELAVGFRYIIRKNRKSCGSPQLFYKDMLREIYCSSIEFCKGYDSSLLTSVKSDLDYAFDKISKMIGKRCTKRRNW